MMEQVLLIAFAVYFIHATFWPEQIFGKLAEWLESWMPEKLTMPLFNCPICMTPWWGTLIYWVCHWLDIALFADVRWPVIILTVFAGAGLNTILLQVNRIANVMNEWYEDQGKDVE